MPRNPQTGMLTFEDETLYKRFVDNLNQFNLIEDCELWFDAGDAVREYMVTKVSIHVFGPMNFLYARWITHPHEQPKLNV